MRKRKTQKKENTSAERSLCFQQSSVPTQTTLASPSPNRPLSGYQVRYSRAVNLSACVQTLRFLRSIFTQESSRETCTFKFIQDITLCLYVHCRARSVNRRGDQGDLTSGHPDTITVCRPATPFSPLYQALSPPFPVIVQSLHTFTHLSRRACCFYRVIPPQLPAGPFPEARRWKNQNTHKQQCGHLSQRSPARPVIPEEPDLSLYPPGTALGQNRASDATQTQRIVMDGVAASEKSQRR